MVLKLNSLTESILDLGAHPTVTLARPLSVTSAWCNRRALPCMCSEHVETDLEQHLARECGWVVGPSDTSSAIALVDRYGGDGIGRNGGAGRSGRIGRYYVKGIGRTPLVAGGTDEMHSSGTISMHECIREAVYSEVAARVFPHSTVPTLGILAIGEHGITPSKSRSLLVRPLFLRPAHFLRASSYGGDDWLESSRDRERVMLACQAAESYLGAVGVLELVESLLLKWADQMAFGYINRLYHGGISASNMSMDGALVDLSGMAALPSVGPYAFTLMGAYSGEELHQILQVGLSLIGSFDLHLSSRISAGLDIRALFERVSKGYHNRLLTEFLVNAGYPRAEADDLVLAGLGPDLVTQVRRALTHFKRRRDVIFSETPEALVPWDLHRIWDDSPPDHLAQLSKSLPVSGFGRQALQHASQRRTQPIKYLYREVVDGEIRALLERADADPGAFRPALGHYIQAKTEALAEQLH